MAKAEPLQPATELLAGYFRVFDEEYDSGDVESAHRVTYHDGRIAFILEFMEDESLVELRLESRDGRRFQGSMWSVDWDVEYAVEMQLWRGPDEEREWLLLGAWEDPDEGPIDWAITLFPDPNIESALELDDDVILETM